MDIYSDIKLDGKNIVDPQFANMWVLELPSLDKLPNLPSGGTFTTAQSNEVLKFDLYVKSTNLPLRKLEYEKTNTNNIIAKGRAQYSNFSMTFIETDSWGISAYFETWLNSIYDFDPDQQVYKSGFERNKLDMRLKFIKMVNTTQYGAFALASTFQPLNLINQGWKILLTKEYTIKRALPVGFSDLNLSSDSGDPLEIEVEFQCENVIPATTDKDIKNNVIEEKGAQPTNLFQNPYG